MHADSIKCIAFTYHLEHYKWLIMLFGLKNAYSTFRKKWMILSKNLENL